MTVVRNDENSICLCLFQCTLGWRILRIALFTLLGIVVACGIGLVIFFVIRYVVILLFRKFSV